MTQERKRRSDAERTNIVERWQQSGLTARDFAAQEGLNVSSLYLWRQQLRAAQQPAGDAELRTPAFSELRLAAEKPPSSQVEIVARNGRVVRVRADISVRSLQHVLAAVEQC
jgi:transposase-like protein